MNLMSISKPATGFTFDGSLMAIAQLQEFIGNSGFDINSISVNASAQSNMKFTVSLSYYKLPRPTNATSYMQLTVLTDSTVVSPEGAEYLQSLTAEQLESNYTVVV